MSIENPILFGTQRDYAYSAFSRAYCGKLTFDDAEVTALFARFWDNLPAPITDERSLFEMAWMAGASAAFNAWYMEILKGQPTVTK